MEFRRVLFRSYSSRTRASTDSFRRTQKLRAAFNELLKEMPPELAATPEAKLLAAASDPSVYNIVHLIYRSPTYEGHSKAYEFSRQPMEDHWRSEEHTSELQSLLRTSHAVFCSTKKPTTPKTSIHPSDHH